MSNKVKRVNPLHLIFLGVVEKLILSFGLATLCQVVANILTIRLQVTF